jgi:hypothetical protein
MSLQLAAQHMASRGRGPDTTLVHMAPQEVAGLQALAKAHGGSLTLNPDTGLPEAGFLSKILPLVAGAFLGPAGFGLTAMQAGLAAGALGTVATGSLKKGLMAGLGAYGGAGLAGGLAGAGTGALSSAAGSAAANSVVPAVATEAVAPALTEGLAGASQSLTPDILGGSADQLASAYGYPTAAQVPAINAGQMVAQATPTITQAPVLSQQAADIGNAYAQEQAAQNAVAQKLATTTPFDTAKAGLGEVMNDPKRFMTKENLQYGLAGLAPMMLQDPTQTTPRPVEATPRFAFDPRRVADPYAGRSSAYTGEVTHFNPMYTRLAAGGGLMDIGPVQAMSDRNEAQTLMANGGQMFAEGGIASMAQGGPSHLGDYSDGGRLLKGPGDGVSDSIPATIADKRPARLADGEFVVPARIVSELGNGSTAAGARKLYAMMDRVQKARKKSIGKNQVAVNSRAENLLPA